MRHFSIIIVIIFMFGSQLLAQKLTGDGWTVQITKWNEREVTTLGVVIGTEYSGTVMAKKAKDKVKESYTFKLKYVVSRSRTFEVKDKDGNDLRPYITYYPDKAEFAQYNGPSYPVRDPSDMKSIVLSGVLVLLRLQE